MAKLKHSCWVVCEDGLTGTENQCVAVAEALGCHFEIKRIRLTWLWRVLSPYLKLEQSWSFHPRLQGPWPDIVIASGRKSIAASRYIKRMSGGKTFTVQIQDPRISPAQFDLVAVPAHDPTRGENVVVTQGAPNRITRARLEAAKAQFAEFGSLPSPRIAVLIGGKSKAYQLTKAITERLAAQLSTLITTPGGGLMITTSRRTGVENETILRDALKGAHVRFWDGRGDNPYFAMLGWADFILVTADSASMLSEACSTGKPVYMIPLDGGHPRIDKLHRKLQDLGALRIFDGQLEPWDYEPLHDAKDIADEIRKRINL